MGRQEYHPHSPYIYVILKHFTDFSVLSRGCAGPIRYRFLLLDRQLFGVPL